MKKIEYLLALLEEMKPREAFAIFGIKPSDFDPTKIKEIHRKLVLKHHPDKGGDVEMMKKVNLAYEILKNKAGVGNIIPKKDFKTWKKEREETDIKFEKTGKIVLDLLKKSLNPKTYKKYFEKISGLKLNHTEKESVSGQAMNARWDHEFFTDNRETVFSIDIYAYLSGVDFTKTLGGGEDTTNFSFYVDNYLYHDKRKQKMKRKTWDIKSSTAQVINPEELFPKATLKKVFAGKKKGKYSKKDFIAAIIRELKGTVQGGDQAKIPITDRYILLLLRRTFMRQGYWDGNGIYELTPKKIGGVDVPSSKRVEILVVGSIPESKESIKVLINTIKKMKKQKTSNKMKEIFKKDIEAYKEKVLKNEEIRNKAEILLKLSGIDSSEEISEILGAMKGPNRNNPDVEGTISRKLNSRPFDPKGKFGAEYSMSSDSGGKIGMRYSVRFDNKKEWLGWYRDHSMYLYNIFRFHDGKLERLGKGNHQGSSKYITTDKSLGAEFKKRLAFLTKKYPAFA